MKDYYETLGVSATSDLVVIRAAYKAMMLKFHPDTNKSADASERAKALNQAFAILGNTEARAIYDREREVGKTASAHAPSSPAPPPPPPPSASPMWSAESDLAEGRTVRLRFTKVQRAYAIGGCAVAILVIAVLSRTDHGSTDAPANTSLSPTAPTTAATVEYAPTETPALAKASVNLAVWPLAAASLAPTSLSDLVAEAIPSGEYIGWDDLQVASVRWLSDGIDYSQTGQASRIGVARVRASGVIAEMLQQSWVELSWSIELSTSGNEKWGPTSITIKPGFDNLHSNGKYICFGTGFTGCTFPIESLDGPHIKLSQACTIGAGENISIAMNALTADGRRGTVVYSRSGGSGGESNSIEVTTLSPQGYCDINKDRGY